MHTNYSWVVPGVGEPEVRYAEVVLAAVLLNADRVSGDEADVLGEAGEAVELGAGRGEAEDGAEVSLAPRQLHRHSGLQRRQLVPDIGL